MNNDKYYGLQEDYEPDDEMTPEGILNPTDDELFNAEEVNDPREEDDQAPLGDEPDFEGPDDDPDYSVGRHSNPFNADNEEGDDEEIDDGEAECPHFWVGLAGFYECQICGSMQYDGE